MKKKIFTVFGFGLIIGALFFGGYFAYAVISTQVGVLIDTDASNDGGRPQTASWRTASAWHTTTPDAVNDTTDLHGILGGSVPLLFNTGGNVFEAARTASGDALATTGLEMSGNVIFNDSNWDRKRSLPSDDDTTPTSGYTSAGTLLYNVNIDDWTRARDAGAGDNITSNDGIQVILPLVVDETGGDFDRVRALDSLTLASTTALGIQAIGQLSTWSETDTPAAATQATASKAAAAAVFHVATGFTGCITDTDSAFGTAILELRDGATGAGTVIRTWYLDFPAANDSKCIDLTIPAMMGTVNTAMTLEFTAGGTANSLQTVTLTGYSVK